MVASRRPLHAISIAVVAAVLLPTLFANDDHCDPLSAPRGLSLLQHWATPPHKFELSADQLTTYIATGTLPRPALLQQMQQAKKPRDEDNGEEAEREEEQESREEEKDHLKQDKAMFEEMEHYKRKCEKVRAKAEDARRMVSEKEKHLSSKFLRAKKLLTGRIREAEDAASKAEVETMLERLTRMHYKQIGSLDRSALYWSDVAAREIEARRIAEAHLKVHSPQNFTEGEAQLLLTAQNSMLSLQDNGDLEAWFDNYWSQLESAEKAALAADAPFDTDEENEVIRMLEKYNSTNHFASGSGSRSSQRPMHTDTATTFEAPRVVVAAPGPTIPNTL